MADRPDITVVVPAHNSATTIAEALDSVAAQTALLRCEVGDRKSEVGVIVVDDASTDDTVRVARDWASRHDASALRFQVSSLSSNAGPAAARNRGIAEARGEWIAFLDADDAWLPHRLEVQFRLAAQSPDVVMWCGETVGFADPEIGSRKSEVGGASERRSSLTSDLRPPISDLRLQDLAIANPVATSTVLVRKGVLEDVGGFDEQFRGPEDYDLWLRIAAAGKAMKIDAPLSLYRYVPGSLSLDDRRFFPQVLRVIDKAFGEGGALSGFPHLRKAAIVRQTWHASWMAFNRGARGRAVYLSLKAIVGDALSPGPMAPKWFPYLCRMLVGKMGGGSEIGSRRSGEKG